MDKISRFIGNMIEKVMLLLMVLLVAVTFLQVLARFVFKIPISWSQEMVKTCFVWIIFMGAAIAVKERTHLTLDMLSVHLPKKLQGAVRKGVLLLMLSCAGILFYGGGRYCISSASKTMVTMPLPANVQYISMPISALLMIGFLFQRIVQEGEEKKEGRER